MGTLAQSDDPDHWFTLARRVLQPTVFPKGRIIRPASQPWDETHVWVLHDGGGMSCQPLSQIDLEE